MSAQEFKPGDTVRFTDLNRAVGSPFWPGAVYTVHYVRQDGLVSIRGIDKPALAKHFEKVEHAEPEDKADLYVEPEATPIEAVLRIIHLDRDDFPACGAGEQMRKVGEPDHTTATKHYFLEWHLGARSEPGADVCADCALIATEPEDADDVEPEPLKEGAEPAFHDDDVHHLKVISGSTTIFDGLAVFEEADSGNITVTPVPRCTSLFEKAGSILRCGQHEGHSDGHWTVGSTPAAAWSDERAYGRVTEGGAS